MEKDCVFYCRKCLRFVRGKAEGSEGRTLIMLMCEHNEFKVTGRFVGNLPPEKKNSDVGIPVYIDEEFYEYSKDYWMNEKQSH